jgi:hypothetical protein
LAKVVLGGQTLSLLLTLLLTPVAYTLWDDFGQFWLRLFRRQKKSAPPNDESGEFDELSENRPAEDKPDRKKHREKVPQVM